MASTNFVHHLAFLVLFHLSTFSLVVSMPTQAPDGNTINLNYLGSVEGKSFFAELLPYRNWMEAQRYCNQSGMHLASINSSSQVTLLQGSYNNVTFHGSFWTGARDAMAASQFVWDYTGDKLNDTVNKFSIINPIQTCANWHIDSSGGGHLDAEPCSTLYGVLCEIYSG